VFTESVTDPRPPSSAYANRASRGVTVVQKVGCKKYFISIFIGCGGMLIYNYCHFAVGRKIY